MAVYTNVEQVTHDAVAINNVRSVSVDVSKPPLLSQSDGKRADSVVGDLGQAIGVTVEIEDDGVDYTAFIGKANEGDLVFKTQLDSAPATFKTITITDVVFASFSQSTDQAAPNTITLTGRAADQDDTYSIA